MFIEDQIDKLNNCEKDILSAICYFALDKGLAGNEYINISLSQIAMHPAYFYMGKEAFLPAMENLILDLSSLKIGVLSIDNKDEISYEILFPEAKVMLNKGVLLIQVSACIFKDETLREYGNEKCYLNYCTDIQEEPISQILMKNGSSSKVHHVEGRKEEASLSINDSPKISSTRKMRGLHMDNTMTDLTKLFYDQAFGKAASKNENPIYEKKSIEDDSRYEHEKPYMGFSQEEIETFEKNIGSETEVDKINHDEIREVVKDQDQALEMIASLERILAKKNA